MTFCTLLHRCSCFLAVAFLIVGCQQNATQQGDDSQNGPDNGNGDTPTVVLDGERYPTDRPHTNGTVYYVAPNGSDTNMGTLGSPWATIQHAADTLQPGDTVYLRDGVYHESVRTTTSGTSAGDIVFAAYSGETPIIDGTGADASNGFIVTHDYIVLQSLTIRNWPENGIWMENAGYPYVIDCEVYDVGYGIGGTDGTHDFVFDHVIARRFDLYGFDMSPGNSDCYNGMFWQCVAHSGRDPEQNVDGFALGHGTQHNFTFYRCITYGVHDGFDVSSRDALLQRCSAYHCGNAGFKIWQDSVQMVNCLSYENGNANLELDWDGDAGTVTVQNCTFVGSETFNIWIEGSGDTLRMYNTIVAGGQGIGLAFEQRDVSRYEGDYNLFQHGAERAFAVGYEDEFSLQQIDQWRTYSGQDAHSTTASSLAEIFIDPAAFDFHLATGSPAVDAGTSSNAPPDDYEGVARPQGAGVDMGVFEQ